MKKKFLIMSILLIIITGCSSNKVEINKIENLSNNEEYKYEVYKGYDRFAGIDENEINSGVSFIELDVNIYDNKVMYELGDYIAIVQIDSVLGSDNYNTNHQEYV